MNTSSPDRPDPVSLRPSVNLEALLGDNEAQLVYEALHRLREIKVEALSVVQAEGIRPNGSGFEPWDFGIPQIDRLLARFGAEPAQPQVESSPARDH